MLAVGELEGESVPLLLLVARVGAVVPTVDESLVILAQMGTVVVCALSGQVELRRGSVVYADSLSRYSLLLGVSSVPLDNSA